MKHILAVFIALVLVLSIAPTEAKSQESTARVLAKNQADVQKALSAGCTVVRQTKGMTALECSPAAAQSLGLPEDIKLYVTDAVANTQIRADAVHQSSITGAGRTIAVIDTGYDYTHPELASSYAGGMDFVNDDMDPMDDNGHGSHVAGIITADGINANARGVAPDARIVALKAVPAFGGAYFSDVVTAIYVAVDGPDMVPNTADDYNVDAISISLGTTSAPYLYSGTCDSQWPEMAAAMQYARSRNALVVVSAGNQGTQGVSTPGCISHATTVGAVDSSDTVAGFSGRGSAVDLVAPGVNIYSTYLNGGYMSNSGTSQAAPMVSGTVALIKQKTPTMSATEVENKLTSTAKRLAKRAPDVNSGWGRIDAFAAAIGVIPGKRK